MKTKPLTVEKVVSALRRRETLESQLGSWGPCNCEGDCDCDEYVEYAYDKRDELDRLLDDAPTQLLTEAKNRIRAEQAEQEVRDREWSDARRAGEPIVGDLHAVIGDATGEDYCSREYWRWEDATAKPALERLGYRHVRFVDGERDSFGPLSRVVMAIKDGRVHELVYG